MKKSVGPFLYALINRYHQGTQEDLVKLLSLEAQEILAGVRTEIKDLSPFVTVSNDQFVRVHPTWIIPHVQKLSPALQKALLSSLPQELHQPLCEALVLDKNELPTLSLSLKKTLREQLWEQVKPLEVLPANFLPETLFSPLLVWEFDSLIALIDNLGLYDLAVTIRHVVDKRRLQSIFTALSSSQQQVFRRLQQHKEILKVPLIDLLKWDGSPEWIKQQVHKRGLLRLGRAFHGQSSDFMWYLTRRFDIPRAQALLSYAKQESSEQIIERLIAQVQEQIQHIQTKKTT